jgi:hypothetical protein
LPFRFLFLYCRSIVRFVKGHLERDEKDSDKLAAPKLPILFWLKKSIDKKKKNLWKTRIPLKSIILFLDLNN